MRNRTRHNYPSLIHCLWAFHILFFAYLLFHCCCYNYYKTPKTIIFTFTTVTFIIIPLLLLNTLLQILSYPGVVDFTTQLLILENIRWLPLCRINKFVLNTLPSKTVAVPYTCGLSAVCIFHARRVILKRSGLRSSFTRKWLVTGMPSPMLKSNQNNCKQNSPRIVVSWRHPLFRASHGLMIVGGGGV